MSNRSFTSTEITPEQIPEPSLRGRPTRQPEQPLAAEIEQQLEQLDAEALIDEATAPGLGALRESVLGELMRRFEDPELVKDIPGTGLIQLAKELIKSKANEPPAPEDVKPHSLLDQITALPAEHAAKLIQAEIGRLETELDAHRQALLELKGD